MRTDLIRHDRQEVAHATVVLVSGMLVTLLVAGSAAGQVFVTGPGMVSHPGADDPSVGYSSLALDTAAPEAVTRFTGVARRVSIHTDPSTWQVQANPGDTIIWRNDGPSPVVISFDAFAFDQNRTIRLGPGDSFSLWFAQPGTYHYTISQADAVAIATSPLTGTVVIVR